MLIARLEQRLKVIFASVAVNIADFLEKSEGKLSRAGMDPGDFTILTTRKLPVGVTSGLVSPAPRYMAYKNYGSALYSVGTEAQYNDKSGYERMAENLTLFEAIEMLSRLENEQFALYACIPERGGAQAFDHHERVREKLVNYPLSVYFPETKEGEEALREYRSEHFKRFSGNIDIRREVARAQGGPSAK